MSARSRALHLVGSPCGVGGARRATMSPSEVTCRRCLRMIHGRWFINRSDDGTVPKQCVRCGCGETFEGLVAWGRHSDDALDFGKNGS